MHLPNGIPVTLPASTERETSALVRIVWGRQSDGLGDIFLSLNDHLRRKGQGSVWNLDIHPNTCSTNTSHRGTHGLSWTAHQYYLAQGHPSPYTQFDTSGRHCELFDTGSLAVQSSMPMPRSHGLEEVDYTAENHLFSYHGLHAATLLTHEAP